MSCLKLKVLKRPPPCLYFVLVRLVAIGRQGESVLLAGSRDTLYPARGVGGGTKRKYLQEILKDVIAGNRGDLF